MTRLAHPNRARNSPRRPDRRCDTASGGWVSLTPPGPATLARPPRKRRGKEPGRSSSAPPRLRGGRRAATRSGGWGPEPHHWVRHGHPTYRLAQVDNPGGMTDSNDMAVLPFFLRPCPGLTGGRDAGRPDGGRLVARATQRAVGRLPAHGRRPSRAVRGTGRGTLLRLRDRRRPRPRPSGHRSRSFRRPRPRCDSRSGSPRHPSRFTDHFYPLRPRPRRAATLLAPSSFHPRCSLVRPA